MRRLTFIILPLLVLAFGQAARAQLLTSLASANINYSSTTLLEQLSSIPEIAVPLSSAPAREITEAEVADMEENEDTEADIFVSSAMANAPEPVNLGGNGSLTLKRQDTGEKVTAHYRAADGSYDAEELKKIDHIMRCSLTGREISISVKLVELLDAVEDKFGKRGLTLLSGYRTLKLNKRTPGAAEHSLHMLGWAAYIKIPGSSSTKIKNFGRKLGAGGVGYYPYMGFTHLDVGRARYWVARRPVRHHRRKRVKAAPARAAHKAPPPRTAAKKTVSKKKS